MAGKIPICPLMSAGNEINIVCVQENCAWYMKNYKTWRINNEGNRNRNR